MLPLQQRKKYLPKKLFLPLTMIISDIKQRIINGGSITDVEAYDLVELPSDRLQELWDAAAEITNHFHTRKFDTCSIVNARSGHCPENCKWCAQSAHFKTSADVYPLIDRDTCMEAAQQNRKEGIGRFSLVTSGRAMRGAELAMACEYIKELAREGDMGLCASMGLLDAEAMKALKAAGITRYHCNMETAPSYFDSLCSTHTIADKLSTIAHARNEGMEVCCGGIIGMGESPRQRVEFALALREVNPVSIPINLLNPIPGTPLENAAPVPDNELITTIAIFRFIHPHATLRFAGGRAAISRNTQLQAIRVGINGAIVGDMLTTLGSTIAADRDLVAEAGLDFD